MNGDEVRFRIAATYFFGAPVFGAAVRYNLFESRLARDDGLVRRGATTQTGGYGRVLKTGETRTDLDGRAEVVLTPERVSYDRRLTLEVEVRGRVEPRGERARQPRSWGAVCSPCSCGRARSCSRRAQPVPIEVQALDHAGKPVSAAVTVDARPGGVEPARAPLHALDAPARLRHRHHRSHRARPALARAEPGARRADLDPRARRGREAQPHHRPGARCGCGTSA